MNLPGTGAAAPAQRLIISAVIPTRNRPDHLGQALTALAAQTRPPDEVVVVDASDEPIPIDCVREQHSTLDVTFMHMPAGLCAQRNAGIGVAGGSHVLLLDDDIDLPEEYLEKLTAYLAENTTCGAVSGVVCEADGSGGFSEGFPPPSLLRLLHAFVFQLGVWGDVEAVGGRPTPVLAFVKRWYRTRGNTWSLAGWPLVTQVRGRAIRTALYGLGATLVRREWLQASPYDERLGPHGIGDNYGVALGFPDGGGVRVLTELRVLHRRAHRNRIDPAETYYRRILALDHFLGESAEFGPLNTLWLVWSLVGNALAFTIRRRWDLLARTVRALATVATRRNPISRSPSVTWPADTAVAERS